MGDKKPSKKTSGNKGKDKKAATDTKSKGKKKK